MIFITSYTYVNSKHIKVFDYFKKKDDLVFILPKKWREKNGTMFSVSDKRTGLKIILTNAHFYHSKYPLIRGLLKGWMPATEKILKKLAKAGDVLYTATEPNLLISYFNGRIAKKLGLKHVIFTWQNIKYENRLSGLKLKLTERLIKKNILLSAGLISGTRKAERIVGPFTSKDLKKAIIPISGVDVERFKPGLSSEFRKKYGLENKIVFTFAGMFEKRKGIIALLDAFKAARSELSDIHLVLIGAGILKGYIEHYINDNSLQACVSIINWVNNSELPGYLSNSDVFIYPSEPTNGWEEQFGYSLIEASSCGLPVISTRSGSIDEVILDNTTGMLVPPGNSPELSGAIKRLAADRDLRNKLGRSGREFILKEYSHSAVAGKLENYLRSL